jgi:hypothetical protein
MLAADFNFGAIIGVEFSEELDTIAKKNVEVYRGERQRCFDLTPILQDAATFDIPDGKTVFYFYYPFNVVVLEKVMRNILESYEKSPRKMIFVFRFDQASWRTDCEELFKRLNHVSKINVNRPLVETLSLVPYSVAVFETSD